MGRNRQIKIRLSDAEHAKLKQKAGAMRLAAWLRQSCLNKMPPQIPPINSAALAQLGRIGNNVNQIAVRLNSDHLVKVDEVLDQIGQLRIALIEANQS